MKKEPINPIQRPTDSLLRSILTEEIAEAAKLMLAIQAPNDKSYSTIYAAIFFGAARTSLSLKQLAQLRALRDAMHSLFGGMIVSEYLHAAGVDLAGKRADVVAYHTRVYTFFATRGASEGVNVHEHTD